MKVIPITDVDRDDILPGSMHAVFRVDGVEGVLRLRKDGSMITFEEMREVCAFERRVVSRQLGREFVPTSAVVRVSSKVKLTIANFFFFYASLTDSHRDRGGLGPRKSGSAQRLGDSSCRCNVTVAPTADSLRNNVADVCARDQT